MFNRSNGLSKEFYLWIINEIFESGLTYAARYYDKNIGICISIWEDPYWLLTAGNEL